MTVKPKSEAEIQHEIRLQLGQRPDVVLFRNECGVATYERGGRTYTVRYGLAKGSADLIGVRRRNVRCECCGGQAGTVGQFVALEVKKASGKVSLHQKQWLSLIRKYGGLAGAVRSVEEGLNVLGISDED